MIFRFNRYSKKSYIVKLLKENFLVILDEKETYDNVADDIVQLNDIRNYKKYIDNMFIEREIERGMKKVRKKEIDNKFFKKTDNDLMEYSNGLTYICLGELCKNHNKIRYDYKFIVCGLLVKLSVIYLLSLKFEISSFNCNSVINLLFLRDIL